MIALELKRSPDPSQLCKLTVLGGVLPILCTACSLIHDTAQDNALACVQTPVPLRVQRQLCGVEYHYLTVGQRAKMWTVPEGRMPDD